MSQTEDLLSSIYRALSGDAPLCALLGHTAQDLRIVRALQPAQRTALADWLVFRIISETGVRGMSGKGPRWLLLQTEAKCRSDSLAVRVSDRVLEILDGGQLTTVHTTAPVFCHYDDYRPGADFDEDFGLHVDALRFRIGVRA